MNQCNHPAGKCNNADDCAERACMRESDDPTTRYLAANVADNWRDKARGLRSLLSEALQALEYHREQTRPISRNDDVITKLRAALPPCGECRLQLGERCDVCGAVQGT